MAENQQLVVDLTFYLK